MNRAAKYARLSIASNTVLIAMKLAVGLMSGAVSIVSEAIHSFMDLAAAIMAAFSIRVAGKPADAEHPYGHGKVENVSGVLEALLIFAAAVIIVVEAVKKLLSHEGVDRIELGIAVMLVSGIVNLFVSRMLYKVARAEDSVALEADALHLKTDVYSAFGVAGGLILLEIARLAFNAPWAFMLDPIIAIVVAVFILKEAWEMPR
jgi:cation diffusion facilitator family transporter